MFHLGLVGLLGLGAGSAGCALLASRPVHDLVIMETAMSAAREVNAETLSPDFFQKASEAYRMAQTEYKLKNFKQAQQWAHECIAAAEEAEFDALKKGGTRSEGSSRSAEK